MTSASFPDHVAEPEGHRLLHGVFPAVHRSGAASAARDLRRHGRHHRCVVAAYCLMLVRLCACVNRSGECASRIHAQLEEHGRLVLAAFGNQARAMNAGFLIGFGIEVAPPLKTIHGENISVSPIRRAASARPPPPSIWPPAWRNWPARAAGRPRSAGQCDHGRRHRQGRAARDRSMKCCSGWPTCRRPAAALRDRAVRRAAGQPRTGRRRSRTGRTGQPRKAAEGRRWPRSMHEYDFILIDCPPALSMLTLNGLCAAHGVIIPMQCEYYALEGLSDLVNTIKKVHANLNPDLQDHRPAARDVRSAHDPVAAGVGAAGAAFRRQGVRDHHSAQCAAGGGAVLWHARRQLRPASKGAQAYIAFGAEMVERDQDW